VHAELVGQAQRGDREAFDALARMAGDQCMAIAFRILRDFDHADDAVQTALLTVWSEIRSRRNPDRFEPWLHRILTNACYAEARQRRRCPSYQRSSWTMASSGLRPPRLFGAVSRDGSAG
jgi:DNA-directed RNA polymerase specialized sigma24 family protein